jgi:hypothetical protein
VKVATKGKATGAKRLKTVKKTVKKTVRKTVKKVASK